MTRIINRRSIAWIMYYSGLLFLIALWGKVFDTGSPLYLMGHRVLPHLNNTSATQDIDNMALLSGHAITDREFERRLKFVMRFRRAGDPKELADGMPGGRAFYLTFDDGYVDNVRFAGPVLHRLGIKAVIFFIGEILRNPRMLPWWDLWSSSKYDSESEGDTLTNYLKRCSAKVDATRGLLRDDPDSYALSEAGQKLYLSESEVESLNAAGLFYAGIHSASHANFLRLSKEEFVQEVEEGLRSVRSLPNYLPLLAYPYGRYDKRVLDYIRSKPEIALAFATGWGTNNNPLALKRVNLNAAPFYLFAAECEGIFDVFNKFRNPTVKA